MIGLSCCFRTRPVVVALSILFFLGMVPACVAAEETQSLTQEEKAEKRLQFNRFVEQELAHDARTRANAKKEPPPVEKNWSLSFTPSYGFDRNVNLDSNKTSDTYLEETLEAKIKFKHPEFLFLGAGNWGFGGNADIFNYAHQKQANYRQLVFNVFGDAKLTPKLLFKMSYDLSSVDYTHDDPLSYLSHRFKPLLSYSWNKQWTQIFYDTEEIKDYSSRRALSAGDTSLENNRLDILSETGTGFRFVPDEKKVFGITTGYKRNNSNDVFHDFNDYHGVKVSGYAYFQLPWNFSTIVYGGYDYKEYDARTFTADSEKPQRDSFFYAGDTINFDLGKNTQFFLSYLYKQNYSNDPIQEYSDYVISAGLTLTA